MGNGEAIRIFRFGEIGKRSSKLIRRKVEWIFDGTLFSELCFLRLFLFSTPAFFIFVYSSHGENIARKKARWSTAGSRRRAAVDVLSKPPVEGSIRISASSSLSLTVRQKTMRVFFLLFFPSPSPFFSGRRLWRNRIPRRNGSERVAWRGWFN